jgi:hypothetical protein
MTLFVVDTNVILVANLAHADASPECVEACVEVLTRIMKHGGLVIDNEYRVAREYLKKTTPRKAKGVGDIFVKWVLTNMKDPSKIEPVSISEISPDMFAEFPNSALQLEFDPDDRKFAAIAHVHILHPVIVQAVDCKWLKWWHALHLHGVTVDFLCGEDVKRFFGQKFPGQQVPALP